MQEINDQREAEGSHVPKVSVIIGCYNSEQYISQCLESVREQTYRDWETIIVDDGSTDATWDRIQAFANREARVARVVRRPVNGGQIVETFSEGLGTARGDLVAFLDADDFWPPDKLAAQVPLHSSRVTISYGRAQVIGADRNFTVPDPPFTGAISTQAFRPLALRAESRMIAVTQLVDRRALTAVGGLRSAGSPMGVFDFATMLSLITVDGTVVFLPQVLGYWRHHGGQTSKTRAADIATFNAALAVQTLESWPELRLTRQDIKRARRAGLADAYFAQVRAALISRDSAAVLHGASLLLRHGGTKRRIQALYAYLALPFGLTYEPFLNLRTHMPGMTDRG